MKACYLHTGENWPGEFCYFKIIAYSPGQVAQWALSHHPSRFWDPSLNRVHTYIQGETNEYVNKVTADKSQS